VSLPGGGPLLQRERCDNFGATTTGRSHYADPHHQESRGDGRAVRSRWVGLDSLLSPLIGTALATAGQIVNVSDRSGSAFFAQVSSDGKLAVGDGSGPLTVDGIVTGRPAAPVSPWSAPTSSVPRSSTGP
jgi:hypothetical protein